MDRIEYGVAGVLFRPTHAGPPPAPKRYRRYGLVWAQWWILLEADGEQCDEPDGQMRCVGSADCLHDINQLADLQTRTAGEDYGAGFLAVIDRGRDTLAPRRIGSLREVGPKLPTE